MLAASCTSERSSGSLIVVVSGGHEARDGIAASRFADGYEARFGHVVVALESLHLETASGQSAGVVVEPVLVELVPSTAMAWTIEGVAPQRWDAVRFASRPARDGVRLGDGVDASIAERMIAEGWSLYLEGTLVGPEGAPGEIPFELGFPVDVDYRECSSGDGTRGIVIPRASTASAEITWHLTHVFFDSYVENASLRAEAFAAAWDGEGPLTTEDLATQRLSRLRGVDGELLTDESGNPLVYLPGMTGATTLREFALSHRFAHWNGLEGECRTELRIAN
ncbi:putative lipoprotein [Sandaracinus amylolyticus]|uniref:Putative lipoprotein n=2 Tax=Sandaracinus amylolyticus TaxID=927083 RepID=A0A0F6YG89_9BACT|nr:putative lipoprotein [Sandaracinus amylolyticus]